MGRVKFHGIVYDMAGFSVDPIRVWYHHSSRKFELHDDPIRVWYHHSSRKFAVTRNGFLCPSNENIC
jgi:hypothetical protein